MVEKHTLRARTTWVGGLAMAVIAGCNDNANKSGPADPLADAPVEWSAFLEWASEELNAAPEAVPLPENPALPEPKWPVIQLATRLDPETIQCDWTAPQGDRDALASFPPMRSDRPAPNFQIQTAPAETGPSLVLTFSGFLIEREQIGGIAIEILQPFGTYFDLVWSRAGKIRVPIPDNERVWKFNLGTDGFAEWSGALSQIAILVPGTGPGVVEVRSLRLLRPENSFPLAVGTRRVEIDREARNVIYAHGPAEVKFENLTLPANPQLRTGLALVAGDARKVSQQAPAARFEIIVEHGGSRSTVLSEEVSAAPSWVDVGASLSPWAGKRVSLVLRSTSDTDSAVACWSNPVIYEPLEDPPIVIIYLIDALAAQHIDLYGYPRATMPRLSAMAKSGVWFANAFANSPRTVESVPDIMLSLPTESHGVAHASSGAPLKLVTLAESLRAAGFATASFCTNVNAGPRQNMDQGFDHFFDRISYWWTGAADRTVPIEDVTKWLQAHHDRPAFLYIHTAEPHAPYTPPSGFAGRYDPNYEGKIDGSYDPKTGFRTSKTKRDLAHVISLYDEEVAYADARLGAFRDALSREGILDRVLWFVTSDHGEQFLQHGIWEHEGDLHNELMRIPLVVAGPGVRPAGRRETPVQLYDLMPTILDSFGLAQPYALAGKSIRPLLSGGPPPAELAARNIVASNHVFRSRGVTEFALIENGRWKLMHRFPRPQPGGAGNLTPFALFDLKADFHEKENVIEAHEALARRLIGEMIRWRLRYAPFDQTGQVDALMFDGDQLRELKALGYIR